MGAFSGAKDEVWTGACKRPPERPTSTDPPPAKPSPRGFDLVCSLLTAVLLVVKLAGLAAGLEEEKGKPEASEAQVPPGLLEKLGGPSRDLNAPVRINPRTELAEKQVLIYYANETAPDEREAENYKTLVEWLRSSDDGEIRHLANSLTWDSQLFPRVVDHEIASLRKSVADVDTGLAVPVVVFTNRLARQGRFLVFAEGRETEVRFEVPRFDDYVYSSNPLAHPRVLRAALAAVAERFDPKSHDFVLGTKSHGDSTGEYAMVPRLCLHAEKTSKAELLDVLAKEQQKLRAEMLDKGEPILGREGRPLTAKDGSRIVLFGGRVVVEGKGRLLLDAEGRQLIDWGGKPVAVKRGGTLAIHDGRLTLSGPDEPLVASDGDPILLLGTKSLWPDAETMGLPAEVESVAILNAQHDPRKGGRLGDDNEPSSAILGTEGLLSRHGLLDKDGLLEKDGALYKDSALDKDGLLKRDGLLHKETPLGVTKQEYFSVLGEVGRERGMYFPLVFVESCWSEIDQVAVARAKQSANVGLLYTSDRAGLKYTTIDYGDVSTRHADAPTFADALHRALLEEHLAQERKRVAAQ